MKKQHPLRLWRLKHKILLVDLAKESGISVSSICRIERGKQRPSFEAMRSLIKATNGAIGSEAFFEFEP